KNTAKKDELIKQELDNITFVLNNLKDDFLSKKVNGSYCFNKLEKIKEDLGKIGKEISEGDNQSNLEVKERIQSILEKLYKDTETYKLLHDMKSLFHMLSNLSKEKYENISEVVESLRTELKMIISKLKKVNYFSESEAKLFMDDVEEKVREYKRDKKVL
ncbi:MAG: hypothetical protein WCX79_02900, partial [Candidatus Paceibacterota bacterium]